MAAKYGLLPTELLERATTLDLQFHYSAEIIKHREEKKRRGESVADTYTKHEVEDMYAQFKGRKK